jgi:hypothetical protein
MNYNYIHRSGANANPKANVNTDISKPFLIVLKKFFSAIFRTSDKSTITYIQSSIR